MSVNLEQLIVGNFVLFVYLITLGVAIYNYRKYFDSQLKYFPVIIAYTFFNEVLGLVIRYSEQFAFFEGQTYSNDLIYNIYDLFYYGFFFWVFWQFAQSQRVRNLIKYLSLLVLGVYIVSCFFQNPITMSLYYATSFASLVLAIFALIYLIRLKEWNWSYDRYNLMVWIAIGLLAFHIVFPGLFLMGYLKSEIWYEYHFQTIIRTFIVVMYSLFCVGLIVSRRRALR